MAVRVADVRGRMIVPGAEVRVFAAGTKTLVSSGLVDSGSGYCSQNLMPVFVAAPARGAVDVDVTVIARGERRVTRVSKVESRELTVKVR